MQIDVNPQFKKAFEILEKEGKNLILTGRAGTGKSTFLQFFCRQTKKQFVLLAPTGVAAVNIGGQTIHSFFRFKPGVTLEEAQNLGKKFQKSKLYQKLELLIIDEISMVRADLLDCIDIFLRTVRRSDKSFGGVQTFFLGDLYQLAPVVVSSEKKALESLYQTPYFFSARVMGNFQAEFIEFEKIYRQHQQKFIDLLNAVRNKTIDDQMIKELNSRVIEDTSSDIYRNYIYLTTRNLQADEINQKNLISLPGRHKSYFAEVEGNFETDLYPAPMELVLKKGARVMFLNNDNQGRWINGSLGWVVKLTDDFVEVTLDDGGIVKVELYLWQILENYYEEKERMIKRKIIGSFLQIPLQLAWAITIHKSQGKTFDKVIIDIGKGTFTHGQVYVALSRCRSFEGLVLKKPIEKKHIWLDRRVIKFLTSYQYKKSEEKMSTNDKFSLIDRAIKEKKKLEIVYLKAKDERSYRVILPKKIYETEYNGYPYTAIEAYCFLRGEERVFNFKRILEIKLVEE